ncbi:MAG: hypothetical protein AAF701_07800, partial [Pseudomonadota bacterium]
AIDGVPTYIFSGDGNDWILAGQNHSGLNVIAVEQGSDTVVISANAADTKVLISTDAADASGMVTIDGMRISGVDQGDYIVIESDATSTWNSTFGIAGDITDLADLEAGLDMITFDAEFVGETGYALITDGFGTNGTIVEFTIAAQGGTITDTHALLTNINLANLDAGDYYEFVEFIEDIPTAPEF